MRLPRLRPSLPLRFTQGFGSGLRLAMTSSPSHCEVTQATEAISRNDLGLPRFARNDTPFSSLLVLRFILHQRVKDKGRSNLLVCA
ncbi:MAG TPA: hypothetical protein G4N93_02855 [Dehalococcoidia bacterium]|nr:hypothetical protein [Dehalococcoidia bacterium]